MCTRRTVPITQLCRPAVSHYGGEESPSPKLMHTSNCLYYSKIRMIQCWYLKQGHRWPRSCHYPVPHHTVQVTRFLVSSDDSCLPNHLLAQYTQESRPSFVVGRSRSATAQRVKVGRNSDRASPRLRPEDAPLNLVKCPSTLDFLHLLTIL